MSTYKRLLRHSSAWRQSFQYIDDLAVDKTWCIHEFVFVADCRKLYLKLQRLCGGDQNQAQPVMYAQFEFAAVVVSLLLHNFAILCKQHHGV